MMPLVVVNMPRCFGDKLIRLKAIHNALLGNPYFPTPWPADIVSLTQFDADIEAFNEAQVKVAAGYPGQTGNRNSALRNALLDVESLKGLVLSTAMANPAHAEKIILSAGFYLKQPGGRHKLTNGAYNTVIAGTAYLTAEGGRAHEWQLTQDKINITALPATPTATTYVHNLVPGQVYYFRMRKQCTRKVINNWCEWIELTIGPGGIHYGSKGALSSSGSLPNAS